MIAAFGEKRFEVVPGKLYTFDGLSISSKLTTSSEDVTGKKPATTIKGPGINEIKTKIPLHAALGVDPRREWEDWERIKDAGIAYAFVLGGKPVGVNKFLLTDVDVDVQTIDGKGEWVSAELSVTLKEFLPPGAQAAQKTAQGASKAAGLVKPGTSSGAGVESGDGAGASTGGGSSLSPVNPYQVSVPTAEEKARMKRENPNL